MTRWWGLGIAVAALVFAGCSGDKDASADASFASTTQPPATTTAPATTVPESTTTTTPPPYSFDDSVPPPPLVNTGTDYEAIYRSLEAYQRWLYAHHPDPELIDDIVVPGTRLFGAYEDDIDQLVAADTRLHDENLEIAQFEVATALSDAVTLHVQYGAYTSVIVDRTATVIDRQTVTDDIVVLLVFDAGRWRAASAEDASAPEIQL